MDGAEIGAKVGMPLLMLGLPVKMPETALPGPQKNRPQSRNQGTDSTASRPPSP